MAFQVNTNVNALNATAQATFTQTSLASSLQKLSSGLRINSAKDDASGMAIADSLRSQANALGQAIRNANDGMAIIQIADKAMDEQVKVLDTIKTKATQAAQDGQTETTRKMIQADINRLIESLDNIAQTTSYNGLALLSGGFTNKEFQIGAYSNQTVKASIGATSSDKIGHVRTEGYLLSAGSFGRTALTFQVGLRKVELESVILSQSAGTGLGVLAEAINRYSDELGGVRAKADVSVIGTAPISGVAVGGTGIKINGVTIVASGAGLTIKDMDSDGTLINAINAWKDTTGVQASIDANGALRLTARDGRGINVSGLGAIGKLADNQYSGKLILTQLGANDIVAVGTGSLAGVMTATADTTGATISTAQSTGGKYEAVTTLREIKGAYTEGTLRSIGMDKLTGAATNKAMDVGAGVTTLKGAELVMDIAESAIKQLDFIRSDLGSVQQQMQSTINNITVTQVNVKSAESGIREVDFAAESANFSNLNILAQAGSYAMSQANAVQQNILRLLQ